MVKELQAKAFGTNYFFWKVATYKVGIKLNYNFLLFWKGCKMDIKLNLFAFLKGLPATKWVSNWIHIFFASIDSHQSGSVMDTKRFREASFPALCWLKINQQQAKANANANEYLQFRNLHIYKCKKKIFVYE